MLFRKDIEKKCAYCIHAGKMDEEVYVCTKKGVVSACDHCHRFKYDPLKRTPARQKPKDFSQIDELDFSL